MNSNAKQDTATEPLGALVAPLAGIGTFVFIIVLCFAAFSNNKTAMPLSFFFAAAAGFYVGRLCYNNSRLTGPELPLDESDPQSGSGALTFWVSGLAVQIIAYFMLCIVLGSNLRAVPRQYGQIVWVAFNYLVFLSMLVSFASVFRIHRDIRNQIVHLFWSATLFAVLYASFVYAANWLADPYTIPGRLG